MDQEQMVTVTMPLKLWQTWQSQWQQIAAAAATAAVDASRCEVGPAHFRVDDDDPLAGLATDTTDAAQLAPGEEGR